MIVDVLVAGLLLASGLVVLTAALGLWRLPDTFLRMHAPGLVYSLASWCVTLASVLHFTRGDDGLSLHVWIIIVLLAIAAPITTVLLARATLFRGRQAGDATLPPPLASRGGADPGAR